MVRLKSSITKGKRKLVDSPKAFLLEKDMQECNNTCDFLFLKKKKKKH